MGFNADRFVHGESQGDGAAESGARGLKNACRGEIVFIVWNSSYTTLLRTSEVIIGTSSRNDRRRGRNSSDCQRPLTWCAGRFAWCSSRRPRCTTDINGHDPIGVRRRNFHAVSGTGVSDDDISIAVTTSTFWNALRLFWDGVVAGEAFQD